MERPARNQVDSRMDALLAEGQEYFMGVGGIHDAAAAIGTLLADLTIDYAIADALALGSRHRRSSSLPSTRGTPSQ